PPGRGRSRRRSCKLLTPLVQSPLRSSSHKDAPSVERIKIHPPRSSDSPSPMGEGRGEGGPTTDGHSPLFTKDFFGVETRWTQNFAKLGTSNIQHSTLNIEIQNRGRADRWALNVECWMLNVLPLLFPLFALLLFSGCATPSQHRVAL